MKGIYCLFSGGFDSSYLIHKILLSISAREEEKDIELNLIAVNGSFSPKKNDREIEARKRLLDYWKAKYFKIKINYYEIKIDTTCFSINSMKTGLSQPNMWLSALLTGIDTTKYDEIIICFSYICGDQALSYRSDIEQIVRSSLQITNIDRIFDILSPDQSNQIRILFPISTSFKEEIFSQLISEDLFVFENCTSCEGLKEYDLCNCCTPCRNLKSSLMNIINDSKTTYEVKHECERLLGKFHVDEIKKATIDLVSDDKEQKVE